MEPARNVEGSDAVAETSRTHIEHLPLASLKAAKRNARTHSKRQLEQIAASIERFGFTTPILIDDSNVIVAGHGRFAAARKLGRTEVPCIRITTMTEAEKRAYAIADNQLALKAGWDKDVLALELGELVDLEFEVVLTGFEPPEIDEILFLAGEASTEGPSREDLAPALEKETVCRFGDVFDLGRHRLVCGDAKDAAAMALLMATDRADMVFADPPYNLPIAGFVSGRGKARHGEFVEGSGEMSRTQFTEFLQASLGCMAAVCRDGAILYVCMDWRHVGELVAAGEACGLSQKALCVWVKTNGGQGSFYRSKHELITVWKHGHAEHVNTFGLGEGGRSRTNVWPYAGVNTFRSGRDEELALHPTVKPVALVADAIRDVSHRNHIVLDSFGGAGTTLIAAHKTGRRARLMELDPAYCDVIIRRWEAYTGQAARLAATGQTFEALAAERLVNPPNAEALVIQPPPLASA